MNGCIKLFYKYAYDILSRIISHFILFWSFSYLAQYIYKWLTYTCSYKLLIILLTVHYGGLKQMRSGDLFFFFFGGGGVGGEAQ